MDLLITAEGAQLGNKELKADNITIKVDNLHYDIVEVARIIRATEKFIVSIKR